MVIDSPDAVELLLYPTCATVSLRTSLAVMMANRFDHQPEWVEPERREVRRWVLRKFLRRVEHFTAYPHYVIVY